MMRFLSDISGQYASEKKAILLLCEKGMSFSLADLAKELETSIPRTSRIVAEMIEEGYLADLGKQESGGGRRPNLYGLNPAAGYFVGIDVEPSTISIAVTDFPGRVIHFEDKIPFSLSGTEESALAFCDRVMQHLDKIKIDRSLVRSYGVNLTGRVNHSAGYSYSFYISEEKPIKSIFEQGFGRKVSIDNDSRGMAFGEYMSGITGDAGTVLFLNVGWGLGMGMVLDGKLFLGKSGFSGEVGHFPLLDNHQICRCGKIGCLETGASGQALLRLVKEKLAEGQPSLLSGKENLTLDDILEAVRKEDVTAIECVESIGTTLGRAIAGLINIFNPDMVIVGGRLSVTEHYLMPQLKMAVNKYSLNLVSSDTVIKVSRLGSKAGAVGASLLSKSRLLNNID